MDASRLGFEEESERVPLTPEQEAQLRTLALERAPEDLAKLNAASTAVERFYALPSASFAACHLGDFERATQMALELLELAPEFEDDWNFGNALHAGHSVLGLVALRRGDTDAAVRELHLSGATPGSPQLNSFGPSMQLAKALLRTGHSEAVLDYLAQCRVFWSMGEPFLSIWERKIRASEVPNFFMHAFR